MDKTKKLVLWVIVIVVVVVLIWWVGSKNNASASTIKIGWIGPLTGSIAAYGEAGQNITNLAVDEINAAGGINGKPLQIIYEDGACDGQTAASAMQKLAVVDQVQAVFGGFCSAESLAAVPIATQNKVLLFSMGSSNPKLTSSSPYFFRDYPSDNSQGQVLADAAYNTKHWKTVAFLQEQTDYPAGIFGAFTQEFQKLGGKTIKEEFATDASDFRTPLLKLKAQNPDALFIDSNGTADAPRILQQMQALGWKPPLLVNDTVADDTKTVSANATALEGALTAQFAADPNNQIFQHLAAAYKAKYAVDLPYQNYAQTEYDAVNLLAAGLKAVGNDGTALAAWSRTISNWQGASGAVTIDAGGDRVGGDTLEMIHNGAAEIVSGT